MRHSYRWTLKSTRQPSDAVHPDAHFAHILDGIFFGELARAVARSPCSCIDAELVALWIGHGDIGADPVQLHAAAFDESGDLTLEIRRA
jgi:hypothetical protein